MTKLLVRKESENLEEALKRVHFEGYESYRAKLVNYNTEYWEVSVLPEPATYGAGAVVLCGFVVWWRRYRSRR